MDNPNEKQPKDLGEEFEKQAENQTPKPIEKPIILIEEYSLFLIRFRKAILK